MPSRVVRAEIVRSKSMSRVSEGAEGLFWRLLLFVDDWGRFDACAAVLKGSLYPLRDSVDSAGILGWLRELHNEGCVHVYMAGGNEYGQLTGWEKHRSNQKRGQRSRLPGPTEEDSPASPEPRGLPGDPLPVSCVLSPVSSKGIGADAPASAPDPIKKTWELGVEAALQYGTGARRWKLTDTFRGSLRALRREYPKGHERVFAAVVHGYRYARRDWDEVENHFRPGTLLRPKNRADYMIAYLEAIDAGKTPPFRAATVVDEYAKGNRKAAKEIERTQRMLAEMGKVQT